MAQSDLRDLCLGAVDDLYDCLNDLDHDALWSLVREIRRISESGGTIWTMGNGGSAATASHFAQDLGLADVDAISLSADAARLTALANDFGYPTTFSKQLEILAKLGDLVLVLSVSGNSPNIIEAAKLAEAKDIVTGGFLGDDGGQVRKFLDHAIIVPSVDFGIVETIHVFLCHVISRFMKDMASNG